MKEQLRNAKRASWANTGVARVGDQIAELGSINERRIFQALRLATGLADITPKPQPLVWLDREGRERKYSADARVRTLSGESIYLEFKPKGLPKPGSAQLAIYEDIGSFLREGCKHRFALVQWDRFSTFARNTAVLTRYWDVDANAVATTAFDEIGQQVVSVGALLDHVDRTQIPALWAGIAQQELCAALHEQRISRETLVSRPNEIFKPIQLDDFITTWWA
jgi:hypothetical protein